MIDDAITLVRGEAIGRQVSLQLELAPGLPAVRGDRVQLQQVIINLVMNGIEAMASVDDAPRTLVVRSNRDEADQIVVAVRLWYQSWEDTTGLPSQIVMRADRRSAAAGTIKTELQ